MKLEAYILDADTLKDLGVKLTKFRKKSYLTRPQTCLPHFFILYFRNLVNFIAESFNPALPPFIKSKIILTGTNTQDVKTKLSITVKIRTVGVSQLVKS